MKKRIVSLGFALALCLALAVPASAAGYAWPIEQVEMGAMPGCYVVTSDHSLYTWGSFTDDCMEAKGNVYSCLWPNGDYSRVTKVMDGV